MKFFGVLFSLQEAFLQPCGGSVSLEVVSVHLRHITLIVIMKEAVLGRDCSVRVK